MKVEVRDMSATTQRTEDTIVATLLAGFWAGIGIEKLDALALKFNLTTLHILVQWWPLLLIAAGTVLLVRHQQQGRIPRMAEVVELPMQGKEHAHAR
jgi:hypothetical protein